MSSIAALTALEILDSRGRPTVQATCELASGAVGTASVPSGASTGRAEAHELRDGDPARYGGLGCRKAVRNVEKELQPRLAGTSFADQRQLDDALLEIDGTADRSRIGANALLAASLAFCRAQAREREIPLYHAMAEMLEAGAPAPILPRPMVNLFSGGKHAGGQLPVQDLLVVPAAAASVDEALATVYAIYQAAAALVRERFGMRLLRADEGGLAPPFENVEGMLDLALEAVSAAGFTPGRDVAIALDVAASHFYQNGRYFLGSTPLSREEMTDRLLGWVEHYPIVALEDGLAEDDWEGWPELTRGVEGRALVIGDDLLCTSVERIRRAVEHRAADGLLLKVNQVGTLSEAAAACRVARGAGWSVTVSARSGETEDDWLADLAVGWGADQIKVGSITQSDRLAKYNRLLRIEADERLPVVAWPNR